ncbi:MAG: PHP domain-containing protein [Candidatus Woesearchaeota archaeon]
MESKIDLHVHTYMSDGDYSPAEVVRKAYEQGVETLAITDHDTISGLEEALQESEKLGITLVPGVEISARNGSSVHILGCFPVKSLEDIEGIEDDLKKTQEGRTERTYQQIEILNQKGYDVSIEESESFRRGVFTSKNHAIKVLMEKGYITSHKEGVKLTETKEYDIPYSDEWVMKPEEAVSLINSYGGVAVLAHPGKLMKKCDIDSFVGDLMKAGLKGIEVRSTKHTEEQTKYFDDLADRYGLIKTCGTDYHREEEGKTMGYTHNI